jgi:hypothetical protein
MASLDQVFGLKHALFFYVGQFDRIFHKDFVMLLSSLLVIVGQQVVSLI